MVLLAVSMAHAEPINYTFTGTATGSVDTTAFSNADVTITISADTQDVVFDGYSFYSVTPLSAEIAIAGIGSGTMAGQIVLFNQQALNYSFAGVQQDMMDVVTVEGLELDTYDLKTAFVPLSNGYLSIGGSMNIPTTMGTVVFNNSGTFTFQAELQPVTPPDSDGDGVPDTLDACDGTPAGEAVNLEGCSIVQEVTGITADIKFLPRTCNKRSKGKWVAVNIEMPPGYDVHDIDRSSILLEGSVPPSPRFYRFGDYDDDGIPDLMVKFKRRDVIGILPEGNEVPVTVTGTVGPTAFEGTDSIRVIQHHKKGHHHDDKQCRRHEH